MRSSLYWIDLSGSVFSESDTNPTSNHPLGRLAIMARPRAGDWLEDELLGWQAEGVNAAVSLLEREEVIELDLNLEAEFCNNKGIEFISFPIADRGVPESAKAAAGLVESLATMLIEGKNVAIHCRAGIGRSSLIAASVMVSIGFTATLAFDQISAARRVKVPDTEEQRVWVEHFQSNT